MKKFAFIEYWGRGYTQDCLTRLLTELNQESWIILFITFGAFIQRWGTL